MISELSFERIITCVRILKNNPQNTSDGRRIVLDMHGQCDLTPEERNIIEKSFLLDQD